MLEGCIRRLNRVGPVAWACVGGCAYVVLAIALLFVAEAPYALGLGLGFPEWLDTAIPFAAGAPSSLFFLAFGVVLQQGAYPPVILVCGLLNMIFWGIVTGLIAQRLIPDTAGRCEACGYDLRGSVGRTTCPECGHPIARDGGDEA